MGENEITRLELRLDNMEQRQRKQIKEHEDEIRYIVRTEIESFKSGVMWFVGLTFGMLFTIISFIAVSHIALKNSVGKNTDGMSIVASKMYFEYPNSYIIEDLDARYNPHRGGAID